MYYNCQQFLSLGSLREESCFLFLLHEYLGYFNLYSLLYILIKGKERKMPAQREDLGDLGGKTVAEEKLLPHPVQCGERGGRGRLVESHSAVPRQMCAAC